MRHGWGCRNRIGWNGSEKAQSQSLMLACSHREENYCGVAEIPPLRCPAFAHANARRGWGLCRLTLLGFGTGKGGG